MRIPRGRFDPLYKHVKIPGKGRAGERNTVRNYHFTITDPFQKICSVDDVYIYLTLRSFRDEFLFINPTAAFYILYVTLIITAI